MSKNHGVEDIEIDIETIVIDQLKILNNIITLTKTQEAELIECSQD